MVAAMQNMGSPRASAARLLTVAAALGGRCEQRFRHGTRVMPSVAAGAKLMHPAEVLALGLGAVGLAQPWREAPMAGDGGGSVARGQGA